MRELSLHILDIVQNSLAVSASFIRIMIIEDLENNQLTIKIKDNGIGMDTETVQKVMDPFYTTRTTRNVGLGIPMFKAGTEACEGHFNIKSRKGYGTEVSATYKFDHIDRMPLGSIEQTIITILNAEADFELLYTHCVDNQCFEMDTREIKKILNGVSIRNMDVLVWIKSYIKEGLEQIKSKA